MMRTFLQPKPMVQQPLFPQATSYSAVKQQSTTTKGLRTPSDSDRFERSTSTTAVSIPPPSSPIRSGLLIEFRLDNLQKYPIYDLAISIAAQNQWKEITPLISKY